MSLYYAAIDNNSRVYFESPRDYFIKYPGIFHPKNPFSCMVVMKNSQGCKFKIENDEPSSYYRDRGYRNVTEQVYVELLGYFPWARGYYESI